MVIRLICLFFFTTYLFFVGKKGHEVFHILNRVANWIRLFAVTLALARISEQPCHYIIQLCYQIKYHRPDFTGVEITFPLACECHVSE